MEEKKDRADSLRHELNLLKKDRKDSLIAVRKRYKEDISTCKNELKQALVEKKNATSVTKPPLAVRIETTVDNATLAVCKPFVKRHDEIQVKRSSPETYPLFKNLNATEEVVAVLKKRVEAGKKLKPRHLEFLVKMIPITLKADGTWLEEEAKELRREMGDLLDGQLVFNGTSLKDVEKKLEETMSQKSGQEFDLSDVMAMFNPQAVK